MKIDKDQIEEKEVAGETKEGVPVVYISTRGGLHSFFTKDEDGAIVSIGAAPHKTIARFLADKKQEGIKWNEEFLNKSEKPTEEQVFEKLRKFIFLETAPLKTNKDAYFLYDTVKKEIDILNKSELTEALSKNKYDKYTIIRDVACSFKACTLEDYKELVKTNTRKLIHYSTLDNLEELDPNKMGTSGVGGNQYKRGLPENKSTFFYTENSKPEDLVTQYAKHKYTADLDPSYKIYDYSTDPDKIVQQQKAANNGAFNEDMMHGMLKEKGYHGISWKMNDDTGVVQMYHPVKVKKV